MEELDRVLAIAFCMGLGLERPWSTDAALVTGGLGTAQQDIMGAHVRHIIRYRRAELIRDLIDQFTNHMEPQWRLVGLGVVWQLWHGPHCIQCSFGRIWSSLPLISLWRQSGNSIGIPQTGNGLHTDVWRTLENLGCQRMYLNTNDQRFVRFTLHDGELPSCNFYIPREDYIVECPLCGEFYIQDHFITKCAALDNLRSQWLGSSPRRRTGLRDLYVAWVHSIGPNP